MKFGKTLRNSVYPPWRGKYIDYHKLKVLLREQDVRGDGASDSEDFQWTEQDEEAFVQELINVQLDKVNAFEVQKSKELRNRTSAWEAKLRPLVPSTESEDQWPSNQQERNSIASEALKELDDIINEMNELEKYSRINFTGFLKAAKKHDRKRGARYRVKPLLQVRLSQLPFSTEDYSPLFRKLSVMYSFARDVLGQDGGREGFEAIERGWNRDTYTSYNFWVHADNILETKTYILRRLPILIYNPVKSKELETIPEDPTITSLYFDNPQFDLYNQRVAKMQDAQSLRLRWTGQLKDKPPIFLEKKVISDDHRREVKVQLKEKHIQEFLDGEYKLEKVVNRLSDMCNGESEQAVNLKMDVQELQSFIREHNLQPMLRANYTRTAFQIPGDNRIRISLDTNVALIREDCLDKERPCRDSSQWHRKEIDEAGMEYPFNAIRTGEIVRFPHALLEIKLRDNAHNTEWVKELMASHLVKEAPRFSKFVHGVATLFEDYVNSFPFWLSELDSDIRRDPEMAFQQEQEKIAQRAHEDMAVGSFLGTIKGSPASRAILDYPSTRFPEPETPSKVRRISQTVSQALSRPAAEIPETPEPEEAEVQNESYDAPSSYFRFASLFPWFSRDIGGRRDSVVLPPGVRPPGTWIKDAGPVRVEAKVYLANQRTFIKWLHISILLASLSLGLYNAAGKHNNIARTLSTVYTFFALFAAGWGWYMYEMRALLIRQRSGRDLDNTLGPIIVCIGLAVALVLNFAFKYTSTSTQMHELPLNTSAIFSGDSSSWRLVKQGP